MSLAYMICMSLAYMICMLFAYRKGESQPKKPQGGKRGVYPLSSILPCKIHARILCPKLTMSTVIAMFSESGKDMLLLIDITSITSL